MAPPDASTGGAAVMLLNPRVAASEAFDAGRATDRPSVTAAAAAQNRLTHAAGTLPQGAMLALCDGSAAEDELRYLAERWGAQSELPPLARVILGTGQAQPVAQRMGGVAAPLRELPLGVLAGSSPRLHAERVLKFGTLLAEARPSALIVSGASHGLVQCVLTARELSIPVVRLGAGDRRGSRADDRAELAALLDRCADLLCVDSLAQRQLLAAEGFPARRIVRVRSLSFGVVQSLLPWLPTFDAQAPDSRLRLPPQWRAQAARGFGLVSAQLCVEDIDSEDALHWLMLARHAGDAMPWLWPVTAASAEVLARPVLRQQLDGSGIAIVPCEDRLERLAMLRAARCLLAGPARDLVDEAVAMDIPTIVVDLYADRSSVCDAGPVVQVGPSASQLKAALVGIEHAAQRGPTHAHAGEDPAMMVIEQIASWFAQRDTGSPGATSEEAAA